MDGNQMIENLLKFYGVLGAAVFALLKGWRWFLDLQEQKQKDSHSERISVIDKELKLAEVNQFTIREVIELQNQVHEVETKMNELDRNMSEIEEDEVQHRKDMKQGLDEVKHSMEKLHDKFYKYLEERFKINPTT